MSSSLTLFVPSSGTQSLRVAQKRRRTNRSRTTTCQAWRGDGRKVEVQGGGSAERLREWIEEVRTEVDDRFDEIVSPAMSSRWGGVITGVVTIAAVWVGISTGRRMGMWWGGGPQRKTRRAPIVGLDVESWEKGLLNEKERDIRKKARVAREQLRQSSLGMGSDASAIMEASGEDEEVREVVFRMTVFRERVLDAVKDARTRLTTPALRRLQMERRGWKLTAFEVNDVLSEVAEDIGAGVVPMARLGGGVGIGRTNRSQSIGTDLLVVSEVLIADVAKKEGNPELGKALIRAAELSLCLSLGLGTKGEAMRREGKLRLYRDSVRGVVEDVQNAPAPTKFASIPSMLLLPDRDVGSIITNEGGLGIRDLLSSAATARRRGKKAQALEKIQNAVDVGTYLLGAVASRSKSLTVACDKYLRGCSRVIGMESATLLEDYAIDYGSRVMTRDIDLSNEKDRAAPGILRRVLASAETDRVYDRAFGTVLTDVITAGLHEELPHSIVVNLRESLELPERLWAPTTEQVLRKEVEKLSVRGSAPPQSEPSLTKISEFLGTNYRTEQTRVAEEALLRRLDLLFSQVVAPGGNRDQPVEVDAVVELAEKLDLDLKATASDIVATRSVRWLSERLAKTMEAFVRDDPRAVRRELDRCARSVTDVISPLYIAFGHGGLDRTVVATPVKTNVNELRLRAMLKMAMANKDSADSAAVVSDYILG